MNYGYPALILDQRHIVHGELIEVSEPDQVLILLDELEDYYGPRHRDNLYERRTATVDGVHCYVYEWARSLRGISMLVNGNDWRSFIQSR
jgi:gamma-glutamylcyclotransferase (GGCT)/AIG2-like uncharacterized protein YtfP